MNTPIDILLKTVSSLAYHREKLAMLEQQMTQIQPEVEAILQLVARRFLVNETGQPVNSGVYWYTHQAIVRVGDTVTIIPMETMDEAKLFAPEPPTNGAAERELVDIIIADMVKEDKQAEAEENVAYVLQDGLTIYHVIHDDCLSENWYTTDPDNNDVDEDDGSGTQFDVRDIQVESSAVILGNHAETLAYAAKMGWLTEAGLKIPETQEAD